MRPLLISRLWRAVGVTLTRVFGSRRYCFRVRFRVQPGLSLAPNQPEIVLRHGSDTASIRPKNGTRSSTNGEEFILIGSKHPSESVARARGEAWIARIKIAAAHRHIGVDFGRRVPQGGWTPDALAAMSAQHNVQAFNDNYGLHVFRCSPPQVFFSGSGELTVGEPRFSELVAQVSDLRMPLTKADDLACDLYASSFFQHSTDAKFVTLVTAMEAMITPAMRSEGAIDHMGTLIKMTEASKDLSRSEKDSLKGALDRLKSESIGHAGRRMVNVLGDREYAGVQPASFFRTCYDLRSGLVHGNIPAPDPIEIANRVGPLTEFVGDIIGRRAGIPEQR